MPEWMNGQNLTTLIVVLLAIWEVIKVIAPRTATKLDDQFVAGVEDAGAWAKGAAPHAWAVTELMAKQNAIPKAQKAANFLLQLREAYLAATGKALPETAINEAKLVAAGISAADKLNRLDGAVLETKPADPQPAPVSQ